MRGIARIVFQHGGLILPSKTPYDRQLVLEHVAQYAKRHGLVRLSINRAEWTVAVADVHTDACAVCREQADNLVYTRGGRRLCHPCACRELR
jgi:hypothetical protein